MAVGELQDGLLETGAMETRPAWTVLRGEWPEQAVMDMEPAQEEVSVEEHRLTPNVGVFEVLPPHVPRVY